MKRFLKISGQVYSTQFSNARKVSEKSISSRRYRKNIMAEKTTERQKANDNTVFVGKSPR